MEAEDFPAKAANVIMGMNVLDHHAYIDELKNSSRSSPKRHTFVGKMLDRKCARTINENLGSYWQHFKRKFTQIRARLSPHQSDQRREAPGSVKNVKVKSPDKAAPTRKEMLIDVSPKKMKLRSGTRENITPVIQEFGCAHELAVPDDLSSKVAEGSIPRTRRHHQENQENRMEAQVSHEKNIVQTTSFPSSIKDHDADDL
ncbi:hypothetical protein QAD02_013611 [Eretmocerus hayati]|uniref:Uncharacterized protein n=1 Tax=Eretmocerus hayati TaxID=131215 RepID=A0ACC2P5K8_9HYME|nr:hypothetical protein QAD02_013611 [Eretmocerus hayati]